MAKVFVEGISKSASEKELLRAIKEVFLQATADLSFLKKGDLVLLKPALNSPDPYPATTHPLALKAVAELLLERSARVIAGDQSGMEYVIFLLDKKDGSSKENYDKSGMGKSGVEFKAFEAEDYEDGYRHFENNKTKSWPKGFYITKWIDKVDHIINLPRISTHAMSGITLGMKNMVGILRDDSRLEFHAEGPYSGIFKFRGLKTGEKKDDKFIEKIVEINLAVREKLRATLFVATEVQTTFGPDNKLIKIFKSHKVKPEEGLVFVSVDPVSADLFALGFLTYLFRKKTSIISKLAEKIFLIQARRHHRLCKGNPRDNTFIKHASLIGLGSMDAGIEWGNVSDGLKKELEKLIK